jgi:basic amino acid/polyamine antiporter, APA family
VRPFRTPWVPFVPVMGILVCIYLMYSLPSESWIRLFVWMTLGVVIYFAYGRKHSKIHQVVDEKIVE